MEEVCEWLLFWYEVKFDTKNNWFVYIIGTGIKYDTYIVTKILNFLKELPTNVHSLISSEFKISILIEEKYANDFLINLHREFIENFD